MTTDLRGLTQPVDDPVSSPRHYTAYPVEVIEITEHLNFCMGNIVKYVLRADHKGNAIEDLQKAAWYLRREIARREAEQLSNPDPTLRIPLDESQALIKERYGNAIEELGQA